MSFDFPQAYQKEKSETFKTGPVKAELLDQEPPPPRSTVRLRRLDSHSSFRSSRGRKSERKSEHMTLLKDTPQLAFCIGFAWQTPGAERSFLFGRGCHGMTDSSKSSKEKKSPPKKAPIEKTLYFHHLWFRFGNLEEFCIKKRLITSNYSVKVI